MSESIPKNVHRFGLRCSILAGLGDEGPDVRISLLCVSWLPVGYLGFDVGDVIIIEPTTFVTRTVSKT